jgi:adenine-specific DNA-methyltransferase
MDKLKMHTADKFEENHEKLVALFPDVITETLDEEGNVVHAIDKDALMKEINVPVVDDKQERYQFTWPDKKEAILLANTPTTKTLRLIREKSVSCSGKLGGGRQ